MEQKAIPASQIRLLWQEHVSKSDAEMTLCMWSRCHDVEMLPYYHAE
jgi:hypothetical protein